MLRVFPVAGFDTMSLHDFAAPRGDGTRSHQGNDLMADEGTPLVAVDDGEIRFGVDPLGGNVANLRASDGTRYYYAHLLDFAGPSPRNVRAGERIGYVGRTGNAASTPPHLHFEMHPNGGAAVDPAPFLDAAARVPIGERTSTPTRNGALPIRALALAALAGGIVYAALNPRALRRLAR